jgi:uncharacterized damage-inducible protein DinB
MRGIRVSLWVVLAATLSGVAAARQAAAPASGFKADLIGSIDDAAKKLVDLAQATPAEKFGWRPAAGVRSVSEVYLHVAAGNYLIPSFIGVKRPDGMDRTMETKITDKAKVVETLQKSIAHLKSAIEITPDADLDKKVKFFGTEMTERALLIHVANHMHEHLGQSIAYARVNGITPPWSATEGAPPAKSSSN